MHLLLIISRITYMKVHISEDGKRYVQKGVYCPGMMMFTLCGCMHICRCENQPEVDIRYLPPSMSTHLTEPGTQSVWSGWPESSRNLWAPHPQLWDCMYVCITVQCPPSYMSARDLNLGHRACLAGMLPTELAHPDSKQAS